MTIVAGYSLDRRDTALSNLLAVLARSTNEDLVIGVITTAPWAMSGAGRDSNESGESYIDKIAGQVLEQARTTLPDDIRARFVVRRARSVPEGLLDLAREHGASALVVGSSFSGAVGSVTAGSIASRLLYSAGIPIIQPPRGFRCSDNSVIRRMTIAYSGSARSELLVAKGRALAASMGATVRLASFAVEIPPPDTALFRAEVREVMRGWEDSLREVTRTMLARQAAAGQAGEAPELVLGRGRSWAEAMDDIDWDHESDLLLVGSSRAGRLARVFIGRNGSKIVSNSPVPVMVMPRLDAE